MNDRVIFDYFYGAEAEQFSFYRMPKVLITDDYFKSISSDAKILYGILLDRISLSIKNNWVDKDNRVYIIYTVEEVMKTMNCCESKAGKLMAELDTEKGIGLIEKKRRGQGKPNLIYVKNFTVDKDYSYLADIEDVNDNQELTDKANEYNKNDNIQSQKGLNIQFMNSADVQVMNPINVRIKNSASEQNKNCKKRGLINTYKNYKNKSYNDSIKRSISIKEDNGLNMIDVYENNLVLIKQIIGYGDLLLKYDNSDISQLNEIIDIMAKFVSFRRDKVIIKGVEYPYDFVKIKILQNDYTSMSYVLDSFNRNTSNKANIEGYIISMLFNAPSSVNNHYTSVINHDNANFDWIQGEYRKEETS